MKDSRRLEFNVGKAEQVMSETQKQIESLVSEGYFMSDLVVIAYWFSPSPKARRSAPNHYIVTVNMEKYND